MTNNPADKRLSKTIGGEISQNEDAMIKMLDSLGRGVRLRSYSVTATMAEQ